MTTNPSPDPLDTLLNGLTDRVWAGDVEGAYQWRTKLHALFNPSLGWQEEVIKVLDEMAREYYDAAYSEEHGKVDQLSDLAAIDRDTRRADALRVAIDHLRRTQEIQWQPVSEAPEEGEWALVQGGGAFNCMFVRKDHIPNDWTDPRRPNLLGEQVTHFMELPEPPPPPPTRETE
jgi:hypothetical protein